MKWHSLQLKLYLFSFSDNEQRQDQRQLPVKVKKDRSFSGPPTYASGLTTKRKPYGRKINPVEFWKSLEQANKSFKRKCDKEGEEITLYQKKFPDQAVCEAMEISHQRLSPQISREPRKRLWKGNAPNNTKDMSINNAQGLPEKTERRLQWKPQSSWSLRNGGQGTQTTRQVSMAGIPKEMESQQRRLNLKYSIWYNGWESSESENRRCWNMHLLKIKIPQTDAQGAGWWTTP